ncbi:MAG: preprotein translocase subunit SecE [Candidatus Harrisonbacteria bacterium RIFCSPLOWO2_02_FULL_41_13b]|uniref:Protein translocase subunit SecE n=1 Tax=Candidatus Harrisonbacteria bacterium RIFCSPLOWO2_02_FULL_41_13b TaxID=1798409 RepID=A0A1G1ZTM7_9BACT|nr:MAG: preprotein translocase subunit SecE [Candidatus Harrisonbacteria bacterium RIFCSPHIGHO2_02_FULL_40_20]OGY67486.1 MAG: preprotein translocase subunit SecE [Candidatus Harrisonbacteria bacterium RIFCSPLOWO2_02_FULL_41_13b]
MLNKIKLFLQESQQEFKKVNWPSSSETVRLTMVVIMMSLGVSVFLGLLDFIFSTALQKLLI